MKMRMIGTVAALAVATSGAFYVQAQPESARPDYVDTEKDDSEKAGTEPAIDFLDSVITTKDGEVSIDLKKLEESYRNITPDDNAIEQMRELLSNPEKAEALNALAMKVRRGIENANPEDLKRFAAKLLSDSNLSATQLSTLTPEQRSHFGTFIQEEQGKTVDPEQYRILKKAIMAISNDVDEEVLKKLMRAMNADGEYENLDFDAVKKFMEFLSSDNPEARKLIEVLNANITNPETVEKAKAFIEEMLAEESGDGKNSLLEMLQDLTGMTDEQIKEAADNFVPGFFSKHIDRFVESDMPAKRL